MFHNSLNAAFELTTAVRQTDKKYAALLLRLRTNQMTEADIALLNTRVVNRLTKLQ